jgi:hypothetical protein
MCSAAQCDPGRDGGRWPWGDALLEPHWLRLNLHLVRRAAQFHTPQPRGRTRLAPRDHQWNTILSMRSDTRVPAR